MNHDLENPMKFLALYLRAPLQSWGASAKFGERTTLAFPTRSAIIGMLAAAAGIDRSDDAWLDAVKDLSMRCLVFAPGQRLVDYHTVGGGYSTKNSWSKRHMSPKANGDTPDPVVTKREYLQDAVFGVILAGEQTALLDSLAEAIQNPVWGVWLGRKSCIPTEPLFAGLFDSDAEAEAALIARANARRTDLPETRIQKIVLEVPVEEGEEVWHDIPLSFATRTYAARSIRQDTPDASF
jgi:CRISPR system Cascade subunit CasD